MAGGRLIAGNLAAAPQGTTKRTLGATDYHCGFSTGISNFPALICSELHADWIHWGGLSMGVYGNLLMNKPDNNLQTLKHADNLCSCFDD